MKHKRRAPPRPSLPLQEGSTIPLTVQAEEDMGSGRRRPASGRSGVPPTKVPTKSISKKRSSSAMSGAALSPKKAFLSEKTAAPRTPTRSPKPKGKGESPTKASTPRTPKRKSASTSCSQSPRTPSTPTKGINAGQGSPSMTPGRKWTAQEVDVLRQSQMEVNPTDKHFWDEVARRVSEACGTQRTAYVCLEKYHELCAGSSTGRKFRGTQPAKKKKPVALAFSLDGLNYGTNKRKRALRNMVKKVEEDYRDDYFATSSKDDDLCPQLSFSDDDSFVIEGPVLIDQPSSSESSGPSSPELLRPVDRDEIDGYITQITKKVCRVRRLRKSELGALREEEHEHVTVDKETSNVNGEATVQSEEKDSGVDKDQGSEDDMPLPRWATTGDEEEEDEVSLDEDEED